MIYLIILKLAIFYFTISEYAHLIKIKNNPVSVSNYLLLNY